MMFLLVVIGYGFIFQRFDNSSFDNFLLVKLIFTLRYPE